MTPLVVSLLVLVAVAALVLKLAIYERRRALTRGGRRLEVLPPPEIAAAGAEAFWMGMHALIRPWWKRVVLGQQPVSWEVVGSEAEISISIWVAESVPPGFVERCIESAWPGASVREVSPSLGSSKPRVAATELVLARPEWFPLGDGPDHNPLRLALTAMSGFLPGEGAILQVVARPAPSFRRRRLARAATAVRDQRRRGVIGWWTSTGTPRPPIRDPAAEADAQAVLAKANFPLWECAVRVAAIAPTRGSARGRIHSLAGAFAMYEGRNGFRRKCLVGGLRALSQRRLAKGFLLSVPELAGIATIPPSGTAPGLQLAGARVVAAPKDAPRDGKVLGVSNHSLITRPVAISVPGARHHLHVIGETGTGKSTLIAQLVLQDAAAGRAAVVIDPKGDLVEAILERLPPGAEYRTCLIDPDDKQVAVGLDVLAGHDHDLVVDHTVGVFKRIFEPYWGPRTDDIMRAVCLTLKQIPGATLAEAPLLLSDAEWRRAIRGRLGDIAGLGAFWNWYDKLPEQQRAQQIAPLLNKLRAFLLRGPVRAIVGQSASKQSIEDLLDSGGLVLVRIPKGTLGEDTSRLLGGLVVARIWQTAMKRASRPEEDRADVALYVDEMHNYLALPKSFEDLLAEARGYHLSLVLAHQHLGQLSRPMRDALGANARTKVAFACSPDDAQVLERHFEPQLTAHDLCHLPAFAAACRPSINGGHGPAFTLTTQPLPAGSPARAREVRRTTAELFARSRAEVDAEIAHRHMNPSLTLLPGPSSNRGGAGQGGGQSNGQSGGQPGERPWLTEPGDEESGGESTN